MGVALFFAMTAHAASAAPSLEGAAAPVTLDEFIREGLRESPRLRSARLEWRRTIERYPQARSYSDPVFSYTYPIEKLETRLGPVEQTFMLTQKIPFPGKLSLKGEIVEKDVKMARLAFEAAVRDLVLDIKKAYYEIYYLDHALELSRERINVFNHYTKAEMNDYSVGESGLEDVLSAETRYADAEYEQILLEDKRRATETRLNTLLNRDPEQPIESVAEPEVEEVKAGLDELYMMAGRNERLLMADVAVDKGELGRRLAGFNYRPDFRFGLKYTQVGDAVMAGTKDGGRDAVAMSVGINIPLWFGRLRASTREAGLAHQRSIRARTAVVNDLLGGIKRTYAEMNSEYRHLKLYSDSLIPRAKDLIDVAEVRYRNGKGSIADLFAAQTMWIRFRLAYYRAVADFLKDRAGLERLTAGFDPRPAETKQTR